MNARAQGAAAALDDATAVVGRLAPWVGLLWITALPLLPVAPVTRIFPVPDIDNLPIGFM